MKPILPLIFTVWMMAVPAVRAQTPPAKPGARESAAPQLCHQELMQSYLLKGTEFSNNRTMILCPTIKKNCCTRHDLQRIFHFTRDVVPHKIAEYKQKLDIMFFQLREIHTQILKDKPVFVGSRRRRNFCAKEFRAVMTFDFGQFYSKLQEEMIHVDHWTQEHSNRFFCMMCDASAHENIILRDNRRSASFNLDYCQDVIKDNKELLKLLNVELVKYMRNVQNVVDCQHYSRSYSLKFPRPDKTELMTQMVTCMEGLDGTRFKGACGKICSHIKFAQIVPLVLGDFDFFHEMVLVFNRFLRYRESGNLISMKLRGFFKKFRIPRRMTVTRRRNFLKNLTVRPPKDEKGKKQSRKLADFSSPKSERRLADLALQKPSQKKHLLSKKSVIHKPAVKSNSLVAQADTGVAATQSLRPGRFLQTEQSVVGGAGRKAKITPLPNTPKPHFDKTLSEFYHDIEIPKVDNPRPTVFRIRGNPIPFDRIEQSWVEDAGINYHGYTNLRFGMSRRTFYQLLYSYRKPEMPDSKLTMFLMDFTPDFFKRSAMMFNDDFVIMPNNYASKFVSEMQLEDDRRRKLMKKEIDKKVRVKKRNDV